MSGATLTEPLKQDTSSATSAAHVRVRL